MIRKTFFVYLLTTLLAFSGIYASCSLKRKASDNLIEDEVRGKRPAVNVSWTSDDEMGDYGAMPPNTPTGTVSSCEYEDSPVEVKETMTIVNVQQLLQVEGYDMKATNHSNMLVFRHDQPTPLLLVQVLRGELKVTCNDPGLYNFLVFVPPGSNLVAMIIPNDHAITLPELNNVYFVSSKSPIALGFAPTIVSLIARRDINQLYQTCGVEFVLQLKP